MFRFLARVLGLVTLAAGFVGLVIDGTRAIANGVVAFTPLGEFAFLVFRERYLQLQPAVERVHPLLWDPLLLGLTHLPAWAVGLVLGVLLLWIGQPRREPSIGYAVRR